MIINVVIIFVGIADIVGCADVAADVNIDIHGRWVC